MLWIQKGRVTSGLREGATGSHKISDYSPVYADGKIVAGKITIYKRDQDKRLLDIAYGTKGGMQNRLHSI